MIRFLCACGVYGEDLRRQSLIGHTPTARQQSNRSPPVPLADLATVEAAYIRKYHPPYNGDR